MPKGYVAIIPSVLKKVLEENGYDKNEVLNAWKRKNYISCEKTKNTKSVRLNGAVTRCIVLDMEKNVDVLETFNDMEELPF